LFLIPTGFQYIPWVEIKERFLMPQTRLSLVVLALGLLQCLLLALMAMTPLPDNISGVAHAAYDSMRKD
jgi:hypothetical protein